MFGLGKRKKDEPQDITITPVSLDNAHSTVQRRNDYPSKNTNRAWAATHTPELPPVPNQDKILIHWYRPPDSGNPQSWWDDNNHDELQRSAYNEHQFTKNIPENIDPPKEAHNPWHNDISGQLRPTAEMSPHNYSFLRPFYPGDGYAQSTGRHFSMASNRRAYPVNGMQPVRSFRNTFRLEPTARDAENMDLSGVNAAAAEPAVYVSPQPTQRRWGL